MDALGIELPPASKPVGTYVPRMQTGRLLLLSGLGPRRSGGALVAVFGEGCGRGVLSAVGLAALPMQIAVEVEVEVETIIQVGGLVVTLKRFTPARANGSRRGSSSTPQQDARHASINPSAR